MAEGVEVVVEQTVDRDQCQGSWLDRPLLPNLRVNGWVLIYLVLVAFIVLTRLWNLAPRAYSHDESIHAWESWKLLTGRGYIHSPVYHGPFLYHFTALIYALFGDNNFTGRLGTSLLGIGIAVMPLFLKKWLGVKGLLAATTLIAISPVMMHRSRFIRHDQGAIFFNMVLLVAILQYLDKRDVKYLYLAAVGLVMGFGGKETTFITYAIYGSFLALLLAWQWVQSKERTIESLSTFPAFDLCIVIGTLILPFASPIPITLLGGNPIDYSPSGLLFSLGITLVVFGISAGIGLWWHPSCWLKCAALFWGLFIPQFTTMFTNGNGIATGVVGQLGYWLSQHDVARGGQPGYYYIVLTVMYEFLPLLLAIGGSIYYVRRGPSVRAQTDTEPGDSVPFVPLMIYWTVLAFLIYSWAGEKMPWLMLHIVLPMAILAGWTVGKLLDGDWRAILERGGLWFLPTVPLLVYVLARLLAVRPFAGTTVNALSDTTLWLSLVVVGAILVWGIVRFWRRVGARGAARMSTLAVLGVLAALTLRFAWMATFINPDSAAELLVYAQGAPDAGIVARELEEMSLRLTGGLHMRVAHDSATSWPMVWYLRNFENAIFFGEAPSAPLEAEVVLVGTGNEAGVRPFLGNEYVRREHRLVWWPYQDWYHDMSPASLWADLRDPQARRALWDVFFYRRWEPALNEWPYVSRFAMYVRRDVVQQLWDAGPEALLALGPQPEDAYAEAWRVQPASVAWGALGAELGQFHSPRGLAVDEDGLVYIADAENHRIQVLDQNGETVQAWGAQGEGIGQFLEPWGVAVAGDGLVYVADTWNHRIQVFDGQGAFLRAWGQFGQIETDITQDGLFYGPRDLAVDQDGSLYVTDTGNKRVLKYDSFGRLVAAVGGSGAEPGQFQEPVGVAIGPDGSVYVADTWNRRIQVFDPELVFLREWDVHAWAGVSVVNKPYLAVDGDGIVWATDPEGYRILAFTSDGELEAVVGRFGSDLEGLNLPTGIVADGSGRLLVSDSGNHRILVYDGLPLDE